MALSPRSARRQTKQPFAFAPQAVASPKLCGRPPGQEIFCFFEGRGPLQKILFEESGEEVVAGQLDDAGRCKAGGELSMRGRLPLRSSTRAGQLGRPGFCSRPCSCACLPRDGMPEKRRTQGKSVEPSFYSFFSEEQLHGPGPGSFVLYRYEAYLHKAVEPSGSGQEGKDDQYDLLSGRSLNHVTKFLLAQAEGCNLPALWRPGGSQNPEPVEEDSGVTGSYFSKRRTKQLSFTCKLCHARMTKLINPHAWERGAIVVRCDGCGVKHQLVDNLGVFDLLQPKDKRDQGREPPRHLWN